MAEIQRQNAQPRLVLVAQGVNLDLLGQRQPEIYGNESLSSLHDYLRQVNRELASNNDLALELECFQTNDMATFLNKLSQRPWNAIIINAGAWTHYCYEIYDRLLAIGIPFYEVHLSDIYQREDFRRSSVLTPAARKVFVGQGRKSYRDALLAIYQQEAP